MPTKLAPRAKVVVTEVFRVCELGVELRQLLIDRRRHTYIRTSPTKHRKQGQSQSRYGTHLRH